MDNNGHSNDPRATLPAVSGSSRKRARPTADEPDSPSVREKREKARERQRRKRERDRAGMMVMSFPPSAPGDQVQSVSAPSMSHSSEFRGQDLSPEEAARRERVRAAARERQRKHRALVKQKKLQELGLDMGNDILSGMEDIQYRVSADGHYQPDMPPPLGPHDGPYPEGQPDGHTFASTLLLSLSCSPLLKQHVTRTLSMTNEELASFEPILAQAWNHWDHERRMHFAEQAALAAKGAGPNHPSPAPAPAPPYGVPEPHPNGNHVPPPFSIDPSQHPQNDFRARFHRSLVAPSPFRTPASETHATGSASSSSSPNSASGDQIDPNLAPSDRTRQEPAPSDIDPELGERRGEA